MRVNRDLNRLIDEHRKKSIDDFSRRYNITALFYAEEFHNINDAVYREQCIKKQHKAWKVRSVKEHDPDCPDWSDDLHHDLHDDWYENILQSGFQPNQE